MGVIEFIRRFFYLIFLNLKFLAIDKKVKIEAKYFP